MHSPARRWETGRWLAHELALLLLLTAVIVVQAVAESSPVDVPASTTVPSPDGAPAVVSVPAAPPAARAAAPPHATFDSRVERWRTISALAAQTVQQTTGVRLDVDLLLALVAVESAGQSDALSTSGAVGLTQVQPATFADLQTRYRALLAGQSVAQPATNVLAGALYLADCARFLKADLADPGDLTLVLDAYNLGPWAALEWRETGTWTNQTASGQEVRDELPAETIEHAARIMAAYMPAPDQSHGL